MTQVSLEFLKQKTILPLTERSILLRQLVALVFTANVGCTQTPAISTHIRSASYRRQSLSEVTLSGLSPSPPFLSSFSCQHIALSSYQPQANTILPWRKPCPDGGGIYNNPSLTLTVKVSLVCIAPAVIANRQ